LNNSGSIIQDNTTPKPVKPVIQPTNTTNNGTNTAPINATNPPAPVTVIKSDFDWLVDQNINPLDISK